MALKAQTNHSTGWSKKQSKSDNGKQILPPIDVIDVEIINLKHISNKGSTISDAISVEHYTHERDLHLAIMASLGLQTSTLHQEPLIDLSEADGDDQNEVKVLHFKPENSCFRKRRRRNSQNCYNAAVETGESSKSTPFVCEICTDTKAGEESFSINGCSHAYCSQCISRYVGYKLEENIVKIGCPVTGCWGMLEPEGCRLILAPEVFDRWGKALCEDVILESEKFYCPYKDCSALFIDDGEEVMGKIECPNCRRAFCVQCKVPWHSGIDCEKFQKLGEHEREAEDIMLINLAETNKWRRCSNCRFYVEKSSGCLFMKCRCGNAFCYNCGGSPQDNSHNYYSCHVT